MHVELTCFRAVELDAEFIQPSENGDFVLAFNAGLQVKVLKQCYITGQ